MSSRILRVEMRHRRHPLLVPFFANQPPSPRRCPLDEPDVAGLVLGVNMQQVGFRNCMWYMGSIQPFHPPLRLVSDLLKLRLSLIDAMIRALPVDKDC